MSMHKISMFAIMHLLPPKSRSIPCQKRDKEKHEIEA